jgi:hypothetical protein
LNIILGKTDTEKLGDKYVILELDTVTIKSSAPIVAYCVVDNIPLEDFPKVEIYKKLHSDLMDHYRNKRWAYCEDAINLLMGFWNKELDTFYESLLKRVQDFKQNAPDENWTGVIAK